MKISITDSGLGIVQKFAKAIGAATKGRFVIIPKSKGSGYITGFSWGSELRMMIRNYHLKENISIDRTNQLAKGQEDIVFLLSGIFPTPADPAEQLSPEKSNILICKHRVSSIMDMPSNTSFGSVTIAVSKTYLNELFGHIKHPVVKTIVEAKENLVFETNITSKIVQTAAEMLGQPVPESLEKQYYKLKCEELLTHTISILLQREAVPAADMHIDDVKAIYAVKLHLQSHLGEPPNIAQLAKEAHMSQPRLRKLFSQTFGKGPFEYYQSARMNEAARLIKEDHLTISEVGYQLGFTNLSHFSRVFRQHIGHKPKSYSKL